MLIIEQLKNNANLLRARKDYKNLIYKFPQDANKIIRAKCYYDLRAFAKMFFPHHCKQPFNKMHKEFFDSFHPEKRDVQKVILASRGSAKTTLICLIYILHCVCYGLEKYILILSSTSPLARRKTKDIHTEVLNNEKLKAIYNLGFESKRVASSETFVVKSMFGESYIHSQSFFSQIRGTKYKDSRVSLCVMDDVVHGEEVFSEEQRVKAERQFNTDIKLASQPGTNFIFIGTRIHDKDLGSELSRRPTWEAKEYPAFIQWPTNMNLWEKWEEIQKDPTQAKEERDHQAHIFYEKNKEKMLEGSKVLWPEREPPLTLMKERLDIGRRSFGAEKQMIAFLTGDSLFQNISYFYQDENEQGYPGFRICATNKFIEYDEHRFIKYYALDPATGERKKATQKKTLSQSARIIACKDTETGFIYVIDAFMDRKPPSRIIYEMYDLHHHHNFYKMGFEENLFRELFEEYIQATRQRWEDDHRTKLTLPTVSIWNTIDKEQRIYGIEPAITSGKILINQHINPDFLAQLQTYPNSDHNDGLDALQILTQVIREKGNLRFYNF